MQRYLIRIHDYFLKRNSLIASLNELLAKFAFGQGTNLSSLVHESDTEP
jgi:hypothetical protein